MAAYYQDLKDASMASALALVHSRFSTNTFPTWPLAHPYRYICHNGEINTLKGNVNWMRARQGRLNSELFGKDLDKLFPIVYEHQSDSACLDNALEFLLLGGRSLPARDDDADSRTLGGESADGSRSARLLSISRGDDGALGRSGGRLFHRRQVDRRDARPQRPPSLPLSGHDGRHRWCWPRRPGCCLPIPKTIRQKGRLQPGRMFLVDTVQGRIIDDEEIKADIVGRKPYRSWVTQYRCLARRAA